MKNIPLRTVRYLAFGLVLLMIIGLLWWYFYLREKGSQVDSVALGRGFSTSVPSFSGGSGSTVTNNAGTGSAGNSSPEIEPGGDTQATGGKKPPRVWQASPLPAASAGFAASVSAVSAGATTTSNTVRYVDRGSGHILELDLATSKQTRLTNTLFPHVYEGLFGAKGRVVLRLLNDADVLETFAGVIKNATTSEGSVVGNYLERSVRDVVFSPAGDKIFYLQLNEAGGVYGILAEPDGSKGKRILTSTLKEWRLQWPSAQRIVLIQKAADGVFGSAFSIDTKGVQSAVIESVPGLTVEYSSGTSFIYSTSFNSRLSLFGVSAPGKEPVAIPLQTVADKCVFAPGSASYAFCGVPLDPPPVNYLNGWYRGTFHTSDAIYTVNAITGATELLVSPESEYGASLDVKDPFVSQDGEYLGFTNAWNGSLWVIRINP